MISVLLFQDLIAILVLLTVKSMSLGSGVGKDALLIVIGFPLVLLFAYLFERYVLMWLFKKFSRFKNTFFYYPLRGAWVYLLWQTF